jgi:hypothetical protein
MGVLKMFDKDFFWNLFLNTGRVDAYLLLKNNEKAEKADEVKKN